MLAFIFLPLLAFASLNPHALLQQAFVLKPSCYFTWANFFIGYGVDSGTTTQGIQYTDATRICQFYTNANGITGQMISNFPDVTSIFPMLQFCQPASNLVGWISSSGSTCNIMSGTTRFGQANVATIIPVLCTDPYSAVFCFFPSAIVTLYSSTVFTSIQGGTLTVTVTNFVPSFVSTTITQLSTTPTTTTETEPSLTNTVVVVTQTILSVITETSETSETTTIRSTLRITDTDFLTTTFTYEHLSISVSVPTVTVSNRDTVTLTVCPE